MKYGALSVLGLAGERALEAVPFRNEPTLTVVSDRSVDRGLSVIGVYGSWAASLNRDGVPSLSFRNKRFVDLVSLPRHPIPSRAAIEPLPPDPYDPPISVNACDNRYGEAILKKELDSVPQYWV
jgi:hypothetical protein